MILHVRNSKLFKGIVCLCALNFLSYTFYSTAAYALTSGPSQPEFTSFEPVAATDMVDLHSGDFTYNLPVVEIPGPNGSGYAMSLSYHSGVTPEQEASWVGLGWTLNPGAINRARRGLPDDYDGEPVEMINVAPPNTTISVSAAATLEVYSLDLLQVGSSNRWNNYRGMSTVTGANIPVSNGLINLGFSVENGDITGSLGYNPGQALNLQGALSNGLAIGKQVNTALNGKDAKAIASGSKAAESGMKYAHRAAAGVDRLASEYGMYLLSTDVRPSNINSYNGYSYNLNFAIQPDPLPAHIGVSGGISGNIHQQTSTAPEAVEGFGWMYSGNVIPEKMEYSAMDYSLENDIPYTRRDKYLPIPFNNHDVYAVSGEGVRGGFRSFNKNIGYFRPTEKHSLMNLYNISIEPGVGAVLSFGASVGFGQQNIDLTDWTNGDDTRVFARPGVEDEAVFFRFNGDMGGNVTYDGADALTTADVSTSGTGGMKKGTYSLSQETHPYTLNSSAGVLNPAERSGRSSFIAYHTNAEMKEQVGDNTPAAYERNVSTETLTNRDANAVAARIGEFAIFNENGSRYTYGLPVYSRSESELSYNMYPDPDKFNRVDNILVYSGEEAIKKSNYYHGQKREGAYASSHLLTEITTPDYIDRTLDGATADDFGGYTKFEYRRLHGNNNYDDLDNSDWYKWRMPYTGYAYSRNSPSSYLDDYASLSSGYKEIYYLQCIKTKTHVAYFITNKTDVTLPNGLELKGSQDERFDSRDAAHSEESAGQSSTAIGNHALEYLERIELYALDASGEAGELIKTTRLEYDYSQCAKTPNNLNTSNQSAENTGKLTLKRVWFEYGGVLSPKIAPYKFDYSYKQSSEYHPSVVSRYPEICSYADAFQPLNAGDPDPQNPDYQATMSDRWGNYRADGIDRSANFDPYMNQVPASNFDPAAWHLKKITLPTGGEILVHYEQDDYAYVQNQPAMAMVGLDDAGGQGFLLKAGSELGLTNAEVSELADLMEHHFISKGERIQFNFLYELISDNQNFYSCNTENIKGYAKVTSVTAEADKIRIELDAPDRPKQLCKNFYKKNRAGQDGCGSIIKADGQLQKGELKSLAFQVLTAITKLPSVGNRCLDYDITKSSFRIPVFKRKLGGGVRVKRLMLYDEGLESDHEDAVLYGTAYDYTTNSASSSSKISSGVASNEPSLGRDANALVRYFDLRKDQKNWLNHGDAKDLMQFEGPLGESILPGASVGYSKVTTSNIHKGASNPGFQVTEFYTTKDAPTTKHEQDDGISWHLTEDYMQATPMESESDFAPIPLIIYNRFVNNIWRSQAYRFLQWNVAGKLKKQTTYSGNVDVEDDRAVSTFTEYTYKTPGETVPMFYGWNDIRQEEPGKEVDVALARRSITDHLNDGNVQVDAGIQYAGTPVPFASAMLYFTQNITEMHSHVSSTVVQYPAILEKVVSMADGVESTVVYEAYNPETGVPVVSTTYDGHHDITIGQNTHDGTYTTTNFSASSKYVAMGQKAYNERAILRSNTMQNGCGLHVTKDTDGPSNQTHFLDVVVTGTCSEIDRKAQLCAALNKVSPGDLVRIRDYASYDAVFHVAGKKGNRIDLVIPETFNQQSWNLEGTHYDVEVEVIRSGKTNQLSASRGSITTYGTPSTPGSVGMDATQKMLRETFAQQLEDKFAGLTDGTSTIVMSSEWNPSLQYIDENGDCVSMSIAYDVKLIADNSASINYECCASSESACQQELTITAPVGTQFSYDENSGKILIGDETECEEILVECLTFCPASYPLTTLGGVLAASALTYSDDWNWTSWNEEAFGGIIPSQNDFEDGKKGKWRVKGTYAYKTDLVSGNGVNGRNYADAGVFEEFHFFNWGDPDGNHKNWIRAADITYYSPNGNALEQRDALGIYSVAKLSHDNSVAELVAQNATLKQVEFNSFEDHSVGEDWQGMEVSSDFAHSGSHAAKVTMVGTSTAFSMPQMDLDGEGMTAKMWVRSGDETAGSIEFKKGTSTSWFEKVAQVGEWSLYSAELKLPQSENGLSVVVFHNWNGPVYVDDLRILPMDAAMAAYVYDPATLRLLATFDDQNFGTFYQYNAEGKLVRKLIETERGLRTLQEQQYHTPQELREQQP